MKKVIGFLSVLLTLAIIIFPSAAYATEFIVDNTQGQLICEAESDELDDVVSYYRNSCGFGIYYYCTNEVDGNLVDFSEDYYKEYCNNDENGVLLALTDDEYYIHLSGDAETLFTDDEIWKVFCSYDEYYNCIAAYINYVGAVALNHYSTLSEEELTEEEITEEESSEEQAPLEVTGDNEMLAYNTLKSDGSLVFDCFDLLGDGEEAALEARLDELSSRHDMDIAVVIVDGLDGKSPQDFADDYYDYNGYGRNETNDGVVLMLSMADRDWHFTTTGKAIEVFSDKAQDYMFGDNVLTYFAQNDWVGGFNCYADECDNCISAFENGEKYPPADLKDIGKYFCISTVIGIAAAFLFVKFVQKKHKTVSMKASANDYLVPGSFKITQSYETFAYKNVTRVKKPDESSSSSGSSTHTSSSGTSHGGSGGKF